MAKFKVLHGRHSEGVIPGTERKDADGKVIDPGKPKVYNRGDIVESSSDLLKMNRRGSPKFMRVDDATVQGDGLERLSLKVLRAIADEEDVGLEGLTRKEQVVAAIRAARSRPQPVT